MMTWFESLLILSICSAWMGIRDGLVTVAKAIESKGQK